MYKKFLQSLEYYNAMGKFSCYEIEKELNKCSKLRKNARIEFLRNNTTPLYDISKELPGYVITEEWEIEEIIGKSRMLIPILEISSNGMLPKTQAWAEKLQIMYDKFLSAILKCENEFYEMIASTGAKNIIVPIKSKLIALPTVAKEKDGFSIFEQLGAGAFKHQSDDELSKYKTKTKIYVKNNIQVGKITKFIISLANELDEKIEWMSQRYDNENNQIDIYTNCEIDKLIIAIEKIRIEMEI